MSAPKRLFYPHDCRVSIISFEKTRAFTVEYIRADLLRPSAGMSSGAAFAKSSLDWTHIGPFTDGWNAALASLPCADSPDRSYDANKKVDDQILEDEKHGTGLKPKEEKV